MVTIKAKKTKTYKVFNIGDYVRFRGQLGIILSKKLIEVPAPMSNYNLYQVEFNDSNKEWINEMYLVE